MASRDDTYLRAASSQHSVAPSSHEKGNRDRIYIASAAVKTDICLPRPTRKSTSIRPHADRVVFDMRNSELDNSTIHFLGSTIGNIWGRLPEKLKMGSIDETLKFVESCSSCLQFQIRPSQRSAKQLIRAGVGGNLYTASSLALEISNCRFVYSSAIQCLVIAKIPQNLFFSLAAALRQQFAGRQHPPS